MMNGERKSPQIEVSRSASGELKSVTELLNTYKPELVEGDLVSEPGFDNISTGSI